MSVGHDTADRNGIGNLLRGVATDARLLIQGEVALARAETSETINRLTTALIAVIGGILIAFVALIVLAFALVDALALYMPHWIAAVVVGVALAIVGGIMAQQGAKSLRPAELIPSRTGSSLSKDVDMVKGHAA